MALLSHSIVASTHFCCVVERPMIFASLLIRTTEVKSSSPQACDASRCDTCGTRYRVAPLHGLDIGVDTVGLFDYTTLRSATISSSLTTLVREHNPRVQSAKV